MAPLLQVKDLRTSFFTDDGIVRAVDGVTYDVEEGETLGLVGESGCGKSVSALSILRLIPSPPMVFQEPMTSLNPVLTIGRQLTEALELHMSMDSSAATQRAIQLLDMVGIPDAESRISDYPHQFSGGMRQRVMIAMALSCNPKLLLADEPTTALDVTIQAQVLEILARLSRELGTSVIIITHNLGVVARYADRVNVMYAGRIVETADAKTLYEQPRHPYTVGLLKSVPRLDQTRKTKLEVIEGVPPDLINTPKGCSFYPRCGFRTDHCNEEAPALTMVEGKHGVACWEWQAVAAAQGGVRAAAPEEAEASE
jgi:oligopeptide/dipeptide ABC transporter ATP-binding protein